MTPHVGPTNKIILLIKQHFFQRWYSHLLMLPLVLHWFQVQKGPLWLPTRPLILQMHGSPHVWFWWIWTPPILRATWKLQLWQQTLKQLFSWSLSALKRKKEQKQIPKKPQTHKPTNNKTQTRAMTAFYHWPVLPLGMIHWHTGIRYPCIPNMDHN